MNPFAALTDELVERPGHNYTVSMESKGRPVPGRAPTVNVPLAQPNPWKLTAMQCASIERFGRGQSCKLIGREFGLSFKTIENHLAIVRHRMEVNTSVEAAVKWAVFKAKP